MQPNFSVCYVMNWAFDIVSKEVCLINIGDFLPCFLALKISSIYSLTFLYICTVSLDHTHLQLPVWLLKYIPHHTPSHLALSSLSCYLSFSVFFFFLAVHWFQLVPSAALLADLVSLVLCRSPRLQGVRECNYHVTIRRQCFSNLLLHLPLTFFPDSLPPRVPNLGLFNRCPILGWELHRHLFVALFWGEEGLCINCCPEQNELLWPKLRVALNYRQNHD